MLIDLSFLIGPRILGGLADGVALTLKVTLLSGCVACLIGAAVAIARVAGARVARAAAAGYVNFFRNTPLLIVLSSLFRASRAAPALERSRPSTARITRSR